VLRQQTNRKGVNTKKKLLRSWLSLALLSTARYAPITPNLMLSAQEARTAFSETRAEPNYIVV
jgi:hypothetical protein